MVWAILIIVAVVLIYRYVTGNDKKGYYDSELFSAKKCKLSYRDPRLRQDVSGTFTIEGIHSDRADDVYNRAPCCKMFLYDVPYLTEKAIAWDSLVLFDKANRPFDMRKFIWYFEPAPDKVSLWICIWRR